jgi:integrase
MSEVINLFAYMKIEVTQDMLSLLDSYSRYELKYKPLESDDHEVRAIAEEINKSKNQNAFVKASLADISSKPSGQNNPNAIIAPKTSISNVGKRYIKENKWGRVRTKSGARLAIIRFGNCIGADKDIADITAKDGYAFAKHLEDEYQAANKTIKSSVSYVKGMFTWAITVPEYESINSNPWPKLLLTKFGNASEEYLPFKPEQISALFALAKLDGKGRMNRREHLLLSILIATGCTLDEAALLCWEHIIKHKEGWHYIDLTKAIVKKSGSRTLLPIPFKLQSLMPPRGHQVTVVGLKNSPDDRLFDYSLDGDGKASRAASRWRTASGLGICYLHKNGTALNHVSLNVTQRSKQYCILLYYMYIRLESLLI